MAEKAAALFDLYAYSDPRGKDLVHGTRSNGIAKSTAAHSLEAAAEMSRILAPSNPESEESLRDNVLRFTAGLRARRVSRWGAGDDELSEGGHPWRRAHPLAVALHQPLGGFESRLTARLGASTPVFKAYNIWGKQAGRRGDRWALLSKRCRGGNPNMTNATNNSNMDGGGHEKLVCLGEIYMAIQWQPRSGTWRVWLPTATTLFRVPFSTRPQAIELSRARCTCLEGASRISARGS